MNVYCLLNLPIEPGRRFKLKAKLSGEIRYDPIQFTGDYVRHTGVEDKRYAGYVLPDNHGVVHFPLRWKDGPATIVTTVLFKATQAGKFADFCKKYEAYFDLSDKDNPKIIFEQGYGTPAVEVPLAYENY